MVRSGKKLSPKQAQAVEVIKNEKKYVIMVVFDDIISEVDFFRADGCEAYGKVMVFTPEDAEGICLAW